MTDIVKLIQTMPDLYTMEGASVQEIQNAEQALGLKFAADYREYVAAFGAISFESHELTGVCNFKRLNVVDVTIEERRNTDVLDDWYVVEQANIEGIVIWQDASGSVYQTGPGVKQKRLCKSLAAYIEL